MHMDTTMMTQGLRLRPEMPRWTPGRVLMWALCLLPVLWFALFGLLVARAAMIEGHIPFFGNPDPKDLAFPLHYQATILTFVASLAAPFGIALLMFLRKPLQLHGARLPIIIFLITFLLMIVFLRTIGAPLGEWWMD
jgi:hypothetical protein